MRLAAAANLEVPAALLLEGRGYTVTVERSDGGDRWTATRGDVELVGESPLQLLGLACVAEAKGASWQATDEQIQDALGRFGLA